MKKLSLLIVVLLFMMGMVKAQNVSMDFIPFYYTGYDISQFDNKILQQRDGDLVANILVAIPSGDNHIQYLMKVIMTDGKIYSNKVMKE